MRASCGSNSRFRAMRAWCAALPNPDEEKEMIPIIDRSTELPKDLSVLTGADRRPIYRKPPLPNFPAPTTRPIGHVPGQPWRSPDERVIRAKQRCRARLKKAASA